jgi:hypothetical protein
MSGTLRVPALDLDFTTGVLPAGLTFARASVATNSFYTDAAGSTYTTYAANAPRFIGGGLYTEELRTNYLLNSDAPAKQTTVTLGAPANNVHILWVIGTGSATVTAGTGASSTTLPVTATAGTPASFIMTTAGTMVVTVSGSLTRFQLERGVSTSGVSFPTSYIPTTGTFVTRAADLCTMPVGSWFNPAASTYYVQASEPFLNINACVPFGAYVGANRSGLLHRASGNISISDAVAGVVDLPGGTSFNGPIYQAIGAIRGGRQAGSLNGGTVGAGVFANIQSGLTTLGIGSANTSLYLCGTIYRARYWPYDLANADLQAATLAPTLDHDFTTGVLPGGLTFQRASAGTYFDNHGTLQSAGLNIPRLDYNPVSLQPLGLLMEVARTNLVPNPRGEGAVVGSPGTDPTGWSTNSVNVTRTIATGTERGLPYVEYRNQNAAAPTFNNNFIFSAASTASIPVTASTAYIFSLYLSFPAGSFTGFTNFNLRFNQYDSTGTALTTLSSTNFVLSTIGMSVGDALTKTRVNYAFTTASNCAFVQPFLQIPITASALDFTVRLAGIQIELGSQVTSLVLPPAGTPGASTRAGEAAYTATNAVPGVNLLSNTIESESVVTYATLPAGSGLVTIELDDGSTNNLYNIRNASPTNTNSVTVFSAGVSVGTGASGNFSANIVMKQASTFDGTGLAGRCVQNAGTIAPFTFTATPTVLNRLAIASGRTSPLGGWIRHTRYWPRILADTELQQVTGPDLAPTIDISLLGPTLDPQLSFARNSTATYIDANATIQYAAANVPRFGYDPVSRTPLGLLIEEARANLLNSSVALVPWATSPAGCVLATDNVAVSPDGTTNASSVVTNDVAGNAHLIYRPYTGAVSTNYCGSAFVKANTYTRVSLFFSNTAFPAGNTGGLFDLTTGTIVTTSGGSTCTITAFPNGWYRVSVTATSVATGGGAYVFGITPAPSTVTLVGQGYTPASTGLGIFVWGPQVETSIAATVFATSYLPTPAGSLTRAADVCFIPMTIAPWLNPAQGTMAVDMTMPQVGASGNQDVIGLDDASINNCYIGRVAAGTSQWQIVAASAGVGGTPGNTTNLATANAPLRAAITYAGGTLTGCLNAGPIATATGTTPVTITRMNLSAIRQAAQNGYKSRIRYWPRVLSTAELQDATSSGQARVVMMV